MEIKHQENSQRGIFYAEETGIQVAELRYTFAGINKLVIEKTQVMENVQRTGTGHLLLDAIVSYARDNALLLVPVCVFAKKVLEETPAYHDVLLR